MSVEEMLDEWRNNILEKHDLTESNKFQVRCITYTPRFKHFCPGLSEHAFINKIFFKVREERIFGDVYPGSTNTYVVDLSEKK